MRHIVVYRASDGRQCYHETEDLDGAVRAVEELRNTQNVSDLGIYSLQGVPIEFRPYYRVEVVPEPPPAPAFDAAPWPEVGQTPVAVESAVEPAVEPSFEPVLEAALEAAEPVPPYEQPEQAPAASAASAASARFGLFSRG